MIYRDREHNRVKVQRGRDTKGWGCNQVWEILPLGHEVQNSPPCFLRSWWSLSESEPKLSLQLGQQFTPKAFNSPSSMTDPTGLTVSTAVTVGLRWQCSYYACCEVFQSIRTCTHTTTGMCMCICTDVQKYLLKFPSRAVRTVQRGTLGMPLHFSADTGWASIMGVTALALRQISGWPSSIAKVTAGKLRCPTQRDAATAPCNPRELQGPHIALLHTGLRGDWHQPSVNVHPGWNPIQ